MINVIIDREFCPDSMIRNWVMETAIAEAEKSETSGFTFNLPEDLVEEWDCPEVAFCEWTRHKVEGVNILYIASSAQMLEELELKDSSSSWVYRCGGEEPNLAPKEI